MQPEIESNGLSITFQLPLSPMRVFAIGIEHARFVAVERPQHADRREHRRPAAGRDEHQGLHRILSLWRGMLSFGELGDVTAGVLEREELAPAGSRIGSSTSR